MDNKKNGIPKLRFPGFTGAWEQRKLRKTNTFFTDGNYGEAYPKSSDMTNSNDGVPFLTGGNLKDGQIDITDVNYITKKKHEELTSGHLIEDDIIIAVRGSLGALGYVNKKNIDWNINSQLAILRTNKTELIGKYLLQFLLSSRGQIELTKRQTGSALKQLPIKALKDINIPITSIREQQKIGQFFNNLDSLITLHQRKLEHLQEQKKGLLQKMFPKNGEVVPEVRFPGFTDAWEQRKLGEVATRVTRKNKNLESTLPLTISAQLGLVDQISYFDKRIASSNLTNYILLNRGEFAYNKSYSNGYPFGAVKRLNRYDKGVIPSLYIAFMPNTIFINSDFMEMYFETSLWHKEVSARASEGARNHGLLNISPSDFMDIYMKIPEKIEEQKKIAKFLEDFDSLIALHQRKLEHLELMKKGLLQQMFV